MDPLVLVFRHSLQTAARLVTFRQVEILVDLLHHKGRRHHLLQVVQQVLGLASTRIGCG